LFILQLKKSLKARRIRSNKKRIKIAVFPKRSYFRKLQLCRYRFLKKSRRMRKIWKQKKVYARMVLRKKRRHFFSKKKNFLNGRRTVLSGSLRNRIRRKKKIGVMHIKSIFTKIWRIKKK
jgi:hypothetical protein